MDLAGLELKELEAFVQTLGHKKFHATQIYQWIWKRGVSDFAEMTNLSRELRAALVESATVSLPEVVLHDVSEDGTVQVRFHGACHGCPSSNMTLHHGIERNLREKVEEVTRVVAVP